ncbi:MAG TPA: Gfo/Idh/MocA family oxidoreductase [Phycisphaerae bacterium]|nr:Gfo/Idh/MocA family oxidoreductase [Phycisphaerae bacterium]
MRKHHVAVIGCGSIARGWHCPNIVNNPRTELAVVCDVNAQVAENFRKVFGAATSCTDWQDAVENPDVDVIVLCTHTNLRSEVIVPALASGKPVFVEKPLAATVSEMQRIVAAVRQTGVPVCVCHNRRSSPAILELRRLLHKAVASAGGLPASVDRSGQGRRESLPEERQIQILMRVNDDCRSWQDWIYRDNETILFAEMVHFIDVALWLNPSPPVRVFAEGSARGNFTLMLRFQDGSLTTITQSLCGHFDYPKELIEVTANHVTLAMDHHVEVRQRGLPDEPFRFTYPFKSDPDGKLAQGMEAFHEAVTLAHEQAAAGAPPFFVSPDKGHARHLDRFLDCIEGNGENPCDVVSAVTVTRITMKLLESIRLGVPLPVGPEDWHIPAV